MMWTIQRHKTLDSTQAEALRADAPHGTVVVAAAQSAGRGQHGRTWDSPEGGLYLSVVLRDIEPRLLPFALGNAVADTLEVAGAEPRLKWVNDVLVDDKKIAGVLVEATTKGDTNVVVGGIGVNLNTAVPEGTCLREELGGEVCIEDFETLLLENLRSALPGDLDAWRPRDALRGRTVTIEGTTGTAAGVDDDGRLLVETPDGIHAFATGRVLA